MAHNHEERDVMGIDRQGTGAALGPDPRQGSRPRLMRTATLIGTAVCNDNAEDLGVIKEIMLDTSSGRVIYAVLSFGGCLGIDDKLFALPWNALTLDTRNKRFVLNVEIARLKVAAGFNKGRWPNLADQIWAREIHPNHGITRHVDLDDSAL